MTECINTNADASWTSDPSYTPLPDNTYTLFLILCTQVSGHGHGFINKHSQTTPFLGYGRLLPYLQSKTYCNE